MGLPKTTLVCALALVAVLSLFASPAAAVDRSNGDYWLYEGSMDFEGVSISGTFRYEFEEKDSLTVGSETYDVNVMKITGLMTGETEDFLGMSASVEMVFDGYTYEVEGGIASVKEDMYTWANMTIGTGSLALVTRMEMQDVTTYSPPLLTGFVEGETGTGDEWDETTNVTSTSTTWVDDVMDSTYSDEYVETFSYSVAAAEETVTTEAGTYSCLKITVTDESDGYEVYWYSSEVGSWVKMSSYSMGDATPYMTLELSECEYGGTSGILILLIFGVVVIILVVIAIVLLLWRRGRTPAQVPQQMPPPPPPSG